jgi:hypothetical protein
LKEVEEMRDDFTTAELIAAMRAGYDSLIEFVTSAPFRRVYGELRSLDEVQREVYVRTVMLNREQLRNRGVVVPEGILIQRSAFGDRRPTLFCVKTYLPRRFHSAWENVNLTFDRDYSDSAVSRAPEDCWRRPVRPDIQALLLAAGLSPEEIPSTFQVAGAFMGD